MVAETPESAPVPQSVARRPVDTSRTRPDSSFKLKDSLRQASQSQPTVKVQSVVEQQVRVSAREEITEGGVVSALEKYIAEHRPEPTVAIALKTHRPLIEGEKVIIAVDNQLQLDKLEALKIHLHTVLTKTLNNGFISLELQLFDRNTTQEEKKLFTASEKFEHFVKLNPVVADLKNIFGLEID